MKTIIFNITTIIILLLPLTTSLQQQEQQQQQERTDEEFHAAMQSLSDAREYGKQLANIAQLCAMFAEMNNVEEVWNCVYHAQEFNSKIGPVIENYKNKNFSLSNNN